MRIIKNIFFLAQTTFLEGIRQKVLWGILFLSLSISLVNIVFTELFTYDLGKVSIEFGLSAVAFCGLLLVFFLAIKMMVDDLEKHHIYMILARPVTIWQYVAGRFLGLSFLLLTATIIIGIGSTVAMQYVLWKYPAFIPPQFTWATYCMALSCQLMMLIMVLSMSFLFFSFSSHHFLTLIFSIFSYLIGYNMELLREIVLKNPYAGVLTGKENFVLILSWIFPNLSLFDKKSVAAYGLAFSLEEFSLLFLYCASYSSLMLFFAIIIIKRKDFV